MNKLGLGDVSPAIVFGRPALESVWLGPAQQRAIEFAAEAKSRVSSAAILGPRSCGKSVVLDQILAATAPKRFFKISDSWDSGRSLLSALLASAELGGADLGEIDQRNLFHSFLDTEARAGRSAMFAIDDAERLSDDVMRELLRIGGMTAGESRPFMLWVGRAESPLASAGLARTIRKGFRGHAHMMPPPSAMDCSAYIKHRLEVAGIDPEIFPVPARMLVGRLSEGSYVRINLLAQAAMLLGRKSGHARLSEALVLDANRSISVAAARRERRSGPGAVHVVERHGDDSRSTGTSMAESDRVDRAH